MISRFSFFAVLRSVASLLALSTTLTACGGGGSSATPPVQPTVVSGSTGAYTCPTSDTETSSGRSSSTASSDAVHRFVSRQPRVIPTRPGALAVTYDLASIASSAAKSTIEAREVSAGASILREYDFTHIQRAVRIISVPTSAMTSVAATLSSQSGVINVGPVGSRRYAASVSQRYFTSNSYFNGFQTPVSSGGVAPPPTYHVAPYEESASVPGQWDKHAIGLDYAFEYSQANNGSGVSNANALGSSSVKIAMIDTGQDATHPLLKAKIAYKRCFITNLNGTQSTSNYVADLEGHGTDTSGIAAADSTVALGFVGSGGAAEIYAYRVFPTPDDNCVNPVSTDQQCGADSSDIASAIEDAIAQNVNVISMSLGGGTCSNGIDSDPVERNAIADAIAANVVVIASSGNSGESSVTAPACDSGVIAVGASALADGQGNGSGTVAGSASAPIEYVASYSNYGSPAAQVGSSSAWGIVAPGGDPNGDTDSDNFHWIENIWTSTPYDSNFAGSCTADYPGTGSTVDCRTLIAGTSMSAASATGAAALILSVSSTYQSSAKMKQLLCATADDISAANEGCGRLDIYRAMATVLGDPHPPT